MKIGAPLKSGKPHDGRAPDYDDWNLNGDLLFWNEPLQCSYELSSMGIRVSPESMDKQLTMAGCDDRRALPFQKAVLSGELPYTIGGGIGQSRLCMLLLGSAHIGEVQASVWDEATRESLRQGRHPAAVKQVFPTKRFKGRIPPLMVVPCLCSFFCLYPGRNSSSPVPPPNKKSPDECLRIFCGGELGTAPLRGQQRAACAGDDSHLAGEISIQFHTASQLRYSAGS